MANIFDDIQLDIVAKHKEINAPNATIGTVKRQRGWFRRYVDKGLYVLGWYTRFVDAGLIRGWFDEFEEYWNKVLSGRPLRFHDFHFLRGVYRQRYQDVEVETGAHRDNFLYAWQEPRNVYSIFGAVYKYGLNPWHYYPLRKYFSRGDKVLEYGAGIAPIVTGLINDGLDHFDFTIADIQQFTYHYAKFRLKQFGVTCIDIDPAILPPLPHDDYNIIFCMTVLEHVQNPKEIVDHLTTHLKPGGYFVFDFFLSDGTKLDTQEAVDQRTSVLDYIKHHYDVIEGELSYTKTMMRTVVKKKNA